MQIDWITFVAQIVNLFVLVWLLKRFLYKPVLDVIEKRRNEINEKIDSATALQRQAESEFQALESEKATFEKSLQKQRNDLAKELTEQRKESLESIKQEASQLKMQLHEQVKIQNENLKSELENFISHDFLNIAGKIITDLTDATPIERVLNLFYKKLINLTKSEKTKIDKIIKNQKVIFVNSSETLSENHKQDMNRFLRDYFEISPKTKIQYKTESTLVLGIEIRFAENSIDWTIKNYLDELEQSLEQVLKHKK
jgi:F-type H+-transporting ATPase subunit b